MCYAKSAMTKTDTCAGAGVRVWGVRALVSHRGKSFCVGDYVFHGRDCVLLAHPGVATVVD